MSASGLLVSLFGHHLDVILLGSKLLLGTPSVASDRWGVCSSSAAYRSTLPLIYRLWILRDPCTRQFTAYHPVHLDPPPLPIPSDP
jgi:hypothetical protein